MTISDFYVEPLGGFDIGKNIAETTAQVKSESDLEDMKKQAIAVFQSGNTDTIAAFMLSNPEMGKIVSDTIKFKDSQTKNNAIASAISILRGADPKEVLQNRINMVSSKGGDASQTQNALKQVNAGRDAKQKALETLALLAPEKYKMYASAVGFKAPVDLKDRYKVVGDRLVDLTAPGKPAVVIEKAKKTTPKTLLDEGLVKVGNNLVSVKDPSNPKVVLSLDKNTPYTNWAKLNSDLKNGNITLPQYDVMKKELITSKFKNKIDLTRAALEGNQEAVNILDSLKKDAVETSEAIASASTEGKISGLTKAVDVDVIAQAVIDGKILIGDVKNTFGVPVQTIVMEKVLNKAPVFNFVQPDAVVKSLTSSLTMQQKQRGMMGSFVNNINRQVDKITTMSEDIVSRVGARALDLPLRELNVRFKGSGNERVFEAYMKEISAEIQKLSQGSTASIAQLPEQNRLEWEKIHDVNLSMNELKKVLAGTKEMANMRIGSVNDEIAYTLNKLGNVPEEISRLKANDNLNPKEITTQEEYDALNPGDTFLENGYRFIKPENNNGQ